MQPYQESSDAIQRQNSEPGRLLKKAGKTALGLLGGGAFINKVSPFLSEYIPEDLAIKGLSKISPKMGKFINGAMENGNSFDEVRDFIGGKVQESTPKEPAKQSGNIVQQYAPDLHRFMTEQIQKGRSPLEAAGLAEMDPDKKGFKKIIEKMKKDHKTTWASLVESIYGSAQQPQQNLQGPQQNAQMGQPMPNPQQQQPAQSNGVLDPAVAQILQQGQAILQRFKG